jgi:two-component system cell cycle sensor histidine kinase/response regulator CckA
VGKGSGLGLATVYGIVQQSGGTISVDSDVGRGTMFQIDLPVSCDGVEATAESPEAPLPRGGVETVLVVEDEAEVRALTREMLEDLGYTVLEARRPREALHIAEEHHGPIHLVLTDVVMPELNGRRLAERLTSSRADMKVLFMSGYTDDAIVHHGVVAPGTCLLQKPFSREALADKVREVLDQIQEA